ncbi:putative l-carnitine dehydratase bile acid-inducible protein F [Mycobacterium xenopi 3993]|nr:putative l-carnitine dehydratase bile acid-inducible protein F [Mycobacterium xenopi 3993]
MSGAFAPARPCVGALDGIRVLELGMLIAGPFAGRLLGDMGAEVIKIEAPGRRTRCAPGGRPNSTGTTSSGQCTPATKSRHTRPAQGPRPRTLSRPGRKVRHRGGELPARHPGKVESRLRRTVPT